MNFQNILNFFILNTHILMFLNIHLNSGEIRINVSAENTDVYLFDTQNNNVRTPSNANDMFGI